MIAEEVARYAVRLVDASRPGRPGAPEFIEKWVKWGAGLRASQALVRGAKARALMHGRYHVSIKDIQALAKPILRHRIMTNFYAESERITPDAIVERLIETVPLPQERHVADAASSARERQFLDPGGRRAPGHARAEGAHDRRRLSVRPAPQPVQGLQRRVRRVPAVHPRRRSVDDRLEGLRAQRSPLRQEVRGGDQPRLPPACST